MKTNNRQLHMERCAAVAALVSLLLVLSACGGNPVEEAPSVPQTTAPTIAVEVPAVQAPVVMPEVTVPAETETDPTAATEAETASGTVSGTTVDLTITSDKVLAMYPSIEDFGEEPEEEEDDETPVEVPSPGTQKNPYVEMLAGYPAQVLTVNIPAGESASYLILGSAGTVVTVDDASITLTQGEQGQPAPASEGETLTLDLGNAVVDPVICLSNTGTEAKACTVSLVEALGIRTNPEPVSDNSRIHVKLEADDRNGHHYLWVAPGGGQLTLSTESELLEIMLPDYGELLVPSAEGDGNIVLHLEAGEKLLIQALAVAGEEDALPPVETEILLDWVQDELAVAETEALTMLEETAPEETTAVEEVPVPGTEENPLVLDGSAELVHMLPLSADQTLYCTVQAEGMILTLTGSDVTVVRDGVEYAVQESSLALTIRDPETVFALHSNSTEEQTLELVFSYPLGRQENPLWLDKMQQVTIPTGMTMYCTAKADGMVMTLKGTDLSVVHNDREYRPEAGIVEIPCHGASAFEPPVFAITNHGEEDAACEISFDFPLGHFMHPIALKLGHNTVQSGEEICYFQWTARETGTLTVTMTGEQSWEYVVNNLTCGVNGEVHNSKDVPAVPSQTVEVTAGDEIQLIFHTKDAALNFAATFAPKRIAETE